MNAFENPKITVTADKSIEEVKNAINSILNANSGVYSVNEINPSFNTYRLSTVDGITAMIINIILTKSSENSTTIDIEGRRPVGGSASKEMLQSAVDGFMNILGRVLNGEEVTAKMVQRESGNSGTMATLFFVLVAAFLIWYVFFKR